jgi:predicted porin
MQRKVVGAAVASALAFSGAALAQSSLTLRTDMTATITGALRASVDNIQYSDTARSPRSDTRVTDDSSRLVFAVERDLGGDLQAIGQLDFRLRTDAGSPNAPEGIRLSGNNHVGLRSRQWGRVFVGRNDLHYFNNESDLSRSGGTVRASSVGILAFAGGGATAIAAAGRTANVVHYATPNWAGFTLIVAHSTAPGANSQETDTGSGTRKGRAWNLQPSFEFTNGRLGYSFWDARFDAPGAATAAAQLASADQRGHRLHGSYRWRGFKVGLAWDKSTLEAAASTGALPAAGSEIGDRTAWSIPASYTWGAHAIHGHYTDARDDKATAAQDAAKMWAAAYIYSFTKETSGAITLTKLINDAGAFYNLYTNVNVAGGLATLPGEDTRLWALTLVHRF